MSGQYRGAGAVEKLLKIARAEAEALRIDLADVEQARESAAAGLAALAETEAAEQDAGGADPVAALRYAEALRLRRFNLRNTACALDAAADAAREKLVGALGEIARLEHLAAVNAAERRKEARQREARAAVPAATGRRAAI